MSTTSQDSDQETLGREESLENLAGRVDRAFAEVQGMEPDQRNKAITLKNAIEEFHRSSLTHIVRKLKSDPRGKELLFELVDVPEVYALFAMHGLVRADLRTRVSRVLEMVRPYMESHGGDVELVDVRDSIVYVRLSGNCSGCSMSSVTLKNTVEESLRQQIPEVTGVEVVSDAAPVHLVSLQSRRYSEEHGWIEGPLLSDLREDKPSEFVWGQTRILLIATRDGWKAYRNACAHQGLPLDAGVYDVESETLTCPWHGFQFDAGSGECYSAPQCQLEAFPSRVRDGRIWIRPES